MPSTYTLISSNVLSSSAASVTFSSIPATYTDLVVRFSARTNISSYTNDSLRIRFNGVATSSYFYVYVRGDGSGAVSYGLPTPETYGFAGVINGNNSTSNVFANGEVYIPNYTSSTQKQYSSFSAQEDNFATAYVGAFANLSTSTDAISSVTFLTINDAPLVTGSSFYLYGIKNS